jgi:hypothetical protein
MTARIRLIARGWVAGLLLVLAAGHPPAPVCAAAEPIAVERDRIYRAGVFLAVDALVENRSGARLEAVEVSVEFYDVFGRLVSVEHAVVTPAILGPGQVGAVKVVTPHSDAVRRITYRFTWMHDGGPAQAVSRRDVWAIGSPTRERPPELRTGDR